MVLASGYTSGDLFQTTSKEQHFGARQGSHVQGAPAALLAGGTAEECSQLLNDGGAAQSLSIAMLWVNTDSRHSQQRLGQGQTELCNVLESQVLRGLVRRSLEL